VSQPTLTKDIAKFIKGLGISKKANPHEWIIEDSQTGEIEESPESSTNASLAEDKALPTMIKSATTRQEKGNHKSQFVCVFHFQG